MLSSASLSPCAPASCRLSRPSHLSSVPRLLHGGHEQLAPLAVVLDVGREPSLISHVAGVGAVLGLDHGLEGVVHLTKRQNKEERKVESTAQVTSVKNRN